MQTLIRYSVVNQDGRAVIRAVPIRRRVEAQPVAAPAEIAHGPREHSLLRMFRRFQTAR